MKKAQERLKLPPMSMGLRVFTAVVFITVAVLLLLFMLMNPMDLPFLPGASATEQKETNRPADSHAASGVAQLYQCPMHPEVIESTQSNCPICSMKLMPMARPGSTGDAGIIAIDPVQVQNIGVASVAATKGTMNRTVRTVGILDFNADLIAWVNTKFSGWIEKVNVTYVGQKVQRGQTLFEIYSPELVTTQDEYLRALEYALSLRDSGHPEALRQAESLLRSTRERLLYWDITAEQIRSLEAKRRPERRIAIISPADGVVVEVMDQALEGMFVEPGMNLYKIADMSSIWVHADIYESDLPWVRAGQPAEVSFPYDRDNLFAGEILFLYPEVSQETRTLKICVQVPNENLDLRAGMYADVLIKGPDIHDAVLVPNSAVLRSGERDLVFVDLGDGKFQPREVQLGIRGEGDVIQVVAGVAPGEMIVTQSQFMLDSESRIQEAIAKFQARRAGKAIPGKQD